MMLFLQIILGVVGTAGLFALSAYVFLAVRGGKADDLLYSSRREDYEPYYSRKNLFLIFAAIGFLVCMYQGADAMLWWMPNSWGGINEDGVYSTFREALAGVFAFCVGIPFLVFVTQAIRKDFDERIESELSNGYRLLLEAAIDPRKFPALKIEFDKKLSNLESQASSENLHFSNSYKGELFYAYRDLCQLATQLELAIRQQSAAPKI